MPKVITPKNFKSNTPKVVKATENFRFSQEYLEKQAEAQEKARQKSAYEAITAPVLKNTSVTDSPIKRQQQIEANTKGFSTYGEMQRYQKNNPHLSEVMGGQKYNPIPSKNPTSLNDEGKALVKEAMADDKLYRETGIMDKNEIYYDGIRRKIKNGEALTQFEREVMQKNSKKILSLNTSGGVIDFLSENNPLYKKYQEIGLKLLKKKDTGKELTQEEQELLDTANLIVSIRKNTGTNAAITTANPKQNAQNISLLKAADIYDDTAYEENNTAKTLNRGQLYLDTGMTSYFEGVANTVNAVTGLITGMKPEDTVSGDNPYAIANSALKEYYQRNGQQVNSFIQDIAVNMAQNAIPMLTAMAGGVSGGETLSRALSSLTMGPSVFGGAYKEGVQLGVKDQGKLLLYSSLVTASELSLEYLLGSVPNSAGGVLSGEIIESISKSVSNVFLKAITKTLGNAVGEFSEETIQGIISPLLQRYILGAEVDTIMQNPIETLSEAAYSGLVGFVTSVLTGGYSNIQSAIYENSVQQNGKIYKDILQQSGVDINEVATFFKEFSNNKNIVKAAEAVIKGDNSDLAVGELITNIANDTKETNNAFYAKIGQNISMAENGVETILNTYEKIVEQGAIYPEDVRYLYGKTKENSANNITDNSVIGEFAFKVQSISPRAQMFGQLTQKIAAAKNKQQNHELQNDSDSGIIAEDDINDVRSGDNELYKQGTVGGSTQRYKTQGGADTRRASGENRVFGETEESFTRRTQEAGNSNRQIVRHGNSALSYAEKSVDNSPASQAVKLLNNAGVKAVYCDGNIETNENSTTKIHTEALTAPDGTVYVSSNSTLNDSEIATHESVHSKEKTNNEAFIEYEAVLSENLLLASDKFYDICNLININHYGGKYDVEDVENANLFIREILAYTNQFVVTDIAFAEKLFKPLFSDWNAVVEAVHKFNSDIGLDIPETPVLQSSAKDGLSDSEADMVAINPKNTKRRHTNAKEQAYLKSVGSDLGVKVVFEDIIKVLSEEGIKLNGNIPDGYIDDDGVVHIGFTVVNPTKVVFKHELTHYGEGTEAHETYTAAVERTKLFKEWLQKKTGSNSDSVGELKGLYRDMVSKQRGSLAPKGATKLNNEMFADFSSEVLFDTTSFEQLIKQVNAKQKPAVVQYVLDFFAYLKDKLSGKKNITFELKRLESAYAAMLREATKKENTADNGGVRYSLNIKHTDGTVEILDNARELTTQQAVYYLEKAKKGLLKWNSYIPVRKDTPQVIIDTLENAGENIENLSLVMQVRKAQQAMSDKNKGNKNGKHGSNIRSHKLSSTEIVEIVNNLDNPNTVILQTNRQNSNGEPLPNNVAVFVEYSEKGKEGMAVIEFESSIDPEFIGTEFGDTNYHTVVTIFEPDTERYGMPFDYVEELLSNPDNYELDIIRRQPVESAIGKKHPNTSNGLPSTDSIPEKKSTVKNNISTDSDNYSSSNKTFSVPMTIEQQTEQDSDQAEHDIINEAKRLREKYNRGEISREEYREGLNDLWTDAADRFGTFPEGENAVEKIPVPKKVAKAKPTKRFIRTLIESGKLTEDMLEDVSVDVLTGDFSHEVISDEKAQSRAKKLINSDIAEISWNEAVGKGVISKTDIALGEMLLVDAIERNDRKRILELSAELSDVFTRAGQAVQAARMLKKMTGVGRLVTVQQFVRTINKDLAEKHGDRGLSVVLNSRLAEQLAETETEADIETVYQDILQDIAAQMPITFLDKLNAWRYFSMLANPRTHIRNLVGNTIFTPVIMLKNISGAVIESLAVSDVSQRTKSIIIKKEYLDFAKKDIKAKETKMTLQGTGHLDAKGMVNDLKRTFKTEALEKLTTGNSKLLEAEDMWFKSIHYKMALAGYLQAQKVNLNNISKATLEAARAYAVQEAKKATFQDASVIADLLNNIKTPKGWKGNKSAEAAVAVTKFAVEGVLPFKRTPINIVKRGVEYSPIGLLESLTVGVYQVSKGEISVSEYCDGLASALTGTGIMLVGVLLSSMGLVNGGFDDEEDKFKQLNGEQEYSVKIGGKSYTIDWAAPACLPLFIGVELAQEIAEKDGFQFRDVIDSLWNTLEPITNLSMLSGVQGVIDAVKYEDSNKTLGTVAGNMALSFGMQFVPSTLGALSRTVDPTQRSWYTDKNSQIDSFGQSAINNVKSKIPGLSFTQTPKINAWGQEVSRGGIGERLAENFISPGYYLEVDYNDMNNELLRLGKATGENIYPKTAAKSFSVNGETKYLTADEYVTYAKAKGQYSHDYIAEFMAMKSYDKLTDDEKAKIIKNLYEYANAKAKTAVSDYDLNKQYKTVTRWEQNGNSAVEYYIYKALKD